MSPDNTRLRKRWGYVFRECRMCIRERQRRYLERKQRSHRKETLEHQYGSVFTQPHKTVVELPI